MLNPITRIYRWFEGFQTPFPGRIPEKPSRSIAGFIWFYARPFRTLIIASALLSAAIALIEVYLFAFVGDLVDWLASEERETFFDSHGLQLIMIAVVVMLLLPVLQLFYEAATSQGLLGNFAMRTRWDTHRYLLRQSVEFFQNDFAGRIAAKMMQTSLGVRDTVIKFTEVLLYVMAYFLGAIFLFGSSDIRLTVPMLAWLTGYVLVLRHFVPRLRQVSMEQAEARSMVTGRVVDSYTNIATVKMFAHADYEDDYAREGMEMFLEPVYRQMRMASNLSMLMTLLNCALFFSVTAISLWLWNASLITVGAIAFALGLILRLHGLSHWIMWEIWNLFENIGVVMDGVETIANDITISDDGVTQALRVGKGAVSYHNISFNYGKEDSGHGVIEHLNLHIAGGEKVGVVGRSGAGKSTLVNLLLRFYDLQQGAILIDGQDIRSVTQQSLRSNIGMVTQDTSLLHRSVIENIRYGNADATEEMVIDAARRARAHGFILELEDAHGRTGYQAHVGERGVKLSGGQRQRIAIARVLLKDAPLLVLDEATSALDSAAEANIQESLYELMAGKTVIAIAHRLSTIAHMDRLVIMDQGKIVEQGSHDELVNGTGLYATLWAHQSGGFLAVGKDSFREAV